MQMNDETGLGAAARGGGGGGESEVLGAVSQFCAIANRLLHPSIHPSPTEECSIEDTVRRCQQAHPRDRTPTQRSGQRSDTP